MNNIMKVISTNAVKLVAIEWYSILPIPIPNSIRGKFLFLIVLSKNNKIEKNKNNILLNKFKGSANRERSFLSQ